MSQTDELSPEQVSELVGSDKTPLNLEIKVEVKSACERHVTVTVSEEDINRYFQKHFDEIMPEASVPGFRKGRAPRKLVEKRYRETIGEQVKGSLLLDSMTQVTDQQDFSAISEPDFDFEAIKVPDSGPMTYEFDIEVRPEFDMPTWKGLELKRYKSEVPESILEEYREKYFGGEKVLAPVQDGVKRRDSVTINISVSVEGKSVAELTELTVSVADTLSFPEGDVVDFAKTLEGAKAGETREFTIKLSADLEDSNFADKEAKLVVTILDVKRPETVSSDEEAPSFSDEERDNLIKATVLRQVEYHSNRHIRDQINSLLTESATWELPPGLLKRQFRRELERAVLELRSSGFDPAEVKAYENTLRQNVMSQTRTLLQEHFILERIAEEEKLEDTAEDYEREIRAIATQQGDSVRRVRANLERRGQMDALRNHIIERKVLELIQSHATITEIPFEFPPSSEGVEESLIGQTISGENIPEARYDERPTDGKENKDTPSVS